MSRRKCLLLVVDALSPDYVQPLIEAGKLPSMKRLLENSGKLLPCTSIFPSITPAATCSIITGAYPAQHGIEGACWFDRDKQEIAYFGDDFRMAMQRGIYDYMVDFADRLNFERLQTKTLYQRLHQQGIDSACINYVWFRGDHLHHRTTPLSLRLTGGQLPPQVHGPKYLKLGSFVETLPEGVPPQSKPTMFSRFGFEDSVTIDSVLSMAAAKALPPMTVAYLPENDDLSHSQGPLAAANTAIVRFDHFLGELVATLGGWETLGEEFCLLIVGDHSQVEYGDSGPKQVRLDKILHDFTQAQTGNGWQASDEIFVCPNMRAAAVYLLDPNNRELEDRVVQRLNQQTGVDQVIYQRNEWIYVESKHGQLRFQSAKPDNHTMKDAYGQAWLVEGNFDALALRFDSSNQCSSHEYPNALERIANSFVPGSRPIWTTTQTDSEFAIKETATHQGGSHGSLHRTDSQAALLVSAGVDLSVLPNPSQPRIVDVATLCEDVFREGNK